MKSNIVVVLLSAFTFVITFQVKGQHSNSSHSTRDSFNLYKSDSEKKISNDFLVKNVIQLKKYDAIEGVLSANTLVVNPAGGKDVWIQKDIAQPGKNKKIGPERFFKQNNFKYCEEAHQQSIPWNISLLKNNIAAVKIASGCSSCDNCDGSYYWSGIVPDTFTNISLFPPEGNLKIAHVNDLYSGEGYSFRMGDFLYHDTLFNFYDRVDTLSFYDDGNNWLYSMYYYGELPQDYIALILPKGTHHFPRDEFIHYFPMNNCVYYTYRGNADFEVLSLNIYTGAIKKYSFDCFLSDFYFTDTGFFVQMEDDRLNLSPKHSYYCFIEY